MSNDDHLLVPVVNIAPDRTVSTPKKILHVYTMWPAWVCKTSQTRPIKQRNVLTMEFFGQEILGLKIPAHDCHSDDDVSALNNSDSDILATIEKADFVEFLDDDS